MIAIVIFSAVILSLAGLSFQIAKRTTRAMDQALHMGRQLAGSDRAATVPFDSLATLLQPDTMMSGPVRAVTTYVVYPISVVRDDVFVITSTTAPANRTDTVVIQRGRVRYPIPLK